MAVTAQLVKELREKTNAGMLDCKKALEANNGDIEKSIIWLREKGIVKAAKKSDRIAAEGLCNVVYNGNIAYVYELNSETDFVAKNDKFLNLLDLIGKELLNSNVNSTTEALNMIVEGKKLEEVLLEAIATIGEKITLRRVQRVCKTDSQTFGSYKHQGGRIATLTVLDGGCEEVAKDICMHVAAINPKYLSQDDISEETVNAEREVIRNEALNENAKSAKPKPEQIIDKMVVGRLNKYLQEICLLNQAFVKNPDLTVAQYVNSKNTKIASYIRLAVGEGIEKKEVDFAAEVMAQVKA